MSYDLFSAYFGIRIVMEPAADVTALELRTDPRMVAARNAKLQYWWGRVTDGGYYFLLIGAELGRLGETQGTSASISLASMMQLITETSARLKQAGFFDEPAVHLQLEAGT